MKTFYFFSSSANRKYIVSVIHAERERECDNVNNVYLNHHNRFFMSPFSVELVKLIWEFSSRTICPPTCVHFLRYNHNQNHRQTRWHTDGDGYDDDDDDRTNGVLCRHTKVEKCSPMIEQIKRNGKQINSKWPKFVCMKLRWRKTTSEYGQLQEQQLNKQLCLACTAL